MVSIQKLAGYDGAHTVVAVQRQDRNNIRNNLTILDSKYYFSQDGWTPLHCAAQAGHLKVVELLVESGASTVAETSNGHIPLWFAASENKLKVVSFLIQKQHDAYKLLDDRRVIKVHIF